MKEYTDDQWIGLARWVGWNVWVENGQLYRRYKTITPPGGWIVTIHIDGLKAELLSPAGRVAIEDRVMELHRRITCFKSEELGVYVAEHIRGKNWKMLSHCDTTNPAEAWVDAGMNLVEGKA